MIILVSLWCLAILVIEVFRNRVAFIDFLSIFNIFFVVFYVGPLLLFNMYPDSGQWKYASAYPAAYDNALVLLVSFTSWLGVVVGFISGKRLYGINKAQWCVSVGVRESLYIYILILSGIIFALVFGFVLLQHGGIERYFLSAIARRSHGTGSVESYFDYFFGVIPLLSVLLLSVYRHRSLPRLTYIACIFMGLTLLCIGVTRAFGIAGRGQMVLALVPMFVLVANEIRMARRPYFKLVVISISGLMLFLWLGVFGRFTLIAFEQAGLSSQFIVELKKLTPDQSSNAYLGALLGFFGESDHFNVGTFRVLYYPHTYEVPRLMLDYARSILVLIPGIQYGDLNFGVSDTLAAINRDQIGFGSGYVPVGYIGNIIANGGVGLLMFWSLVAGYIGSRIERIIMCNQDLVMKSGLFVFGGFLWYQIFFHFDGTQVVRPLLGHYVLVGILMVTLVLRKSRRGASE